MRFSRNFGLLSVFAIIVAAPQVLFATDTVGDSNVTSKRYVDNKIPADSTAHLLVTPAETGGSATKRPITTAGADITGLTDGTSTGATNIPTSLAVKEAITTATSGMITDVSGKQDKDNTTIYKVGYNGGWAYASNAVSVDTTYLKKTLNSNNGAAQVAVDTTKLASDASNITNLSSNSSATDKGKLTTAWAVKGVLETAQGHTDGVVEEILNKHAVNAALLKNENSIYWGGSNTAGNDPNKEVVIGSINTELIKDGVFVIVTPKETAKTNVNGRLTLSVNGTEKYPILYETHEVSGQTAADIWTAGRPSMFVFVGGTWNYVGPLYNDFIGADPYNDGYRGLVPTPTANDADKNRFLSAKGGWAEVSVPDLSDYMINGAYLSNQRAYFYGESTTAGGTAAKVVTIPSINGLYAGQIIAVKTTNTSTVANNTLTLKKDNNTSFGAKTIRYKGAALTTETAPLVWVAGGVSFFVYDGTYWNFAGGGDDKDTTYSADDTTVQLTGTQFSAKTAAVADGGTALTTGDQVYDFVTTQGYITSSSLPTVNNATLTIQKNGSNVGTFTANASTDETINVTVPTTVSELTDSGNYELVSNKVKQESATGSVFTNQNTDDQYPSAKAVYNAIHAVEQNAVQSDWAQTTTSAPDYIKNKPGNFTGPDTTAHTNGTSGFVPAPLEADNAKFLRGDGTWAALPDISGNTVNGAPLSNAASYFYGESTTAAATVQKEVSIPSITSLNAGQIIAVKPTVTATKANDTLKLNDFPAYPILYKNEAITTSTDSIVWSANIVSFFLFDGTSWHFAGGGTDNNTTYSLITQDAIDTGTATAARTINAKLLRDNFPVRPIVNDVPQGVGSAVNPVYVDTDGVVTPTTYELNADVPSNAEFTDTTYTFGTGSVAGAISVTPEGGSAQDVLVNSAEITTHKLSQGNDTTTPVIPAVATASDEYYPTVKAVRVAIDAATSGMITDVSGKQNKPNATGATAAAGKVLMYGGNSFDTDVTASYVKVPVASGDPNAANASAPTSMVSIWVE